MLPADLQSPGSRSPITYSKVLIVEGRDAFEFFKALLRNLNLLAEIEIRNAGGVDQFSDYLRTLMAASGFSRVISLGIVRDAEEDADAAFQSVCTALRQVGMSEPQRPMAVADGKPRISVFILPDCENRGMLETLCVQAVRDDPAYQCVEQYFQCLQQQGVVLPYNMSKARLHTFLSSRPEAGLLLGQAAHRNYLPGDNPAFDHIRQFLQEL